MGTVPRTYRRSRKQRTNHEPVVRVLVRAAIVAVVLGGAIYIALSAYNGVPLRHYRTAYVVVPEIGDLLQHDPVRIDGVLVGQVTSISSTSGGEVRVGLQLNPGTDLPADSKVEIRADGLLGARYVELIRGHSTRQLPADATISGAANSITYGVPEALDVFDAQTRGQLGNLIGGLGEGLLGHGTTVNEMLGHVSDEIGPAQQLINTILARPGATAALLPGLRSAAAPLDVNRVPLTSSFASAAAAFEPFVDHRAQVQATLDAAPAALDAAHSGLATGVRLLSAVQAVASSASATLPDAPAGLRAATSLLRTSHAPLRAANNLLVDLGPTVPAVLAITSSAEPLLDPLTQAFGNLIPIVTQLGAYGCNIVNFATTWRSMTGYGGTGSGPAGPSMEFRLEAIAPLPQDTLGFEDTTGLDERTTYEPPCSYLSKPYPDVISLASGGSS